MVHQEIVNRFSTLMLKEKMAHAYLFAGPMDVGKSQTALRVAKLINCENNDIEAEGSARRVEEPCDNCSSCQKINAGIHPDIVILESGAEQSIRIAQVRNLLGKSHLRPYEAKKKIFIIKNIEDLTVESSNALLKTLEEPTKDSLLLLTTSSPEKNLSTVRSRCHLVCFFPSSPQWLQKQLVEEYHCDDVMAHFLSYYAEGCWGQAKNLYENDFYGRKNEIIDNMAFNRNNESYVKTLISDKIQVREVLNVLLSLFRDILLLKVIGKDKEWDCSQSESGPKLIHLDRINDLSRLESRYSFNQLKEIMQEIIHTVKLLDDNLNIKIPFSLLRGKIWLN